MCSNRSHKSCGELGLARAIAPIQIISNPMKHRLLRVNKLLKRALSGIIGREITFDNLLVSVNHVDITPDLKSAHVFISVLGKEGRAGVLPKLEVHRTVLQAELSRHVVLKYTPHLVFHLDDSIERGARVIEILQEIEKPLHEDRAN
jgi:ribosome-binding factor A